MTMGLRLRSSARCLAMIALAAGLLSCERIYPVRTLPNWVRGIYIPMIRNTSTELGVEEIVTRMTQEEFLADGRIRIVRKGEADLELVATIESYRIRLDDTDSDAIHETEEIIILTRLQLYDPFNPDRPVADLGMIETTSFYNADPRSIGHVIGPDAKRYALSLLARQIVDRTINGFPASLANLPPGAELPQILRPDSAARRNILRNRTDVFD